MEMIKPEPPPVLMAILPETDNGTESTIVAIAGGDSDEKDIYLAL